MSPSLLHPACCPSNKTLEMTRRERWSMTYCLSPKGRTACWGWSTSPGWLSRRAANASHCFPCPPCSIVASPSTPLKPFLGCKLKPQSQKQSPLYFRTCIADCSGCVQEERDNFKFKSKCHPQRVKVKVKVKV